MYVIFLDEMLPFYLKLLSIPEWHDLECPRDSSLLKKKLLGRIRDRKATFLMKANCSISMVSLQKSKYHCTLSFQVFCGITAASFLISDVSLAC